LIKRIAIGVVAALALAACGSSTTGGTSGVDGPGNLPGVPGATSGGGKSSDFSQLLAQAKQAKYKVTYAQSSGDTFTLAQDPPKFSMIDGDSATYVTADGDAVECSLGAGTATSAAPTCTSLPGSGSAIQQAMSTTFGAIGTLFVTLASQNLSGLVNIKTTSKSIAGRDAECATIDKGTLGVLGAALGNASYQVCVDKGTGVMLSSGGTDENGKTNDIHATKFSEPTDADFTPPATPTTIP
jgi:hypothetical protein